MKRIGTDIERSVEHALNSYRPRYYETSLVVREIDKVDAGELELLYSRITDVFSQYFIDTATWGLDRWEQIFQIQTDYLKSYEQRRSVLKSTVRRYGTSTVEKIKNVAESYLNGEVALTEKNDIYTLNVKFIGKRGVPVNMDDIKNAIRAVTPSHLGLTYEFTYLVWSEAETMTWTAIETNTWESLEGSFV